MQSCYIYRPPTKMCEGNVFTSLCLFTRGCMPGLKPPFLREGGMPGLGSLLGVGVYLVPGPFQGGMQGIPPLEGTPLEGTQPEGTIPRRYIPWC